MTLAQLELFSNAAARQRKGDMLEHITAVAAGSRYDERSLSELVEKLKS
jgi:hypothetical protein